MKRADIQTGVVYAWSSQNDIHDPYAIIRPVVILDTDTLWRMATPRWGFSDPRPDTPLVTPVDTRKEGSETGLLGVWCKDLSPSTSLLDMLAKVDLATVRARTYEGGTHLHSGHFEIVTVKGRQLKGDYHQVLADAFAAATLRRQEAEAAETARVDQHARLYKATQALSRAGITAWIYGDHLTLNVDNAERLVDLLGDSPARKARAT